jgi:hypothetical protein
VAAFPDQGLNVKDLMQQADLALFATKSGVQNYVVIGKSL